MRSRSVVIVVLSLVLTGAPAARATESVRAPGPRAEVANPPGPVGVELGAAADRVRASAEPVPAVIPDRLAHPSPEETTVPALREAVATPVVRTLPAVRRVEPPAQPTLRAEAPAGASSLPVYRPQRADAAGSPAEEIARRVRLGADSATFRACPVSGGDDRCSPPAPMGSAVPLDADGDGRLDSVVRLAPRVDESFPPPTGFSVSMSVQRLDTGSPLAAGAVAVFSVPEAFKAVTVGFDGSSSTLSARAEASFTIEDLGAALGGEDLRFRVRAEHEQPGGSGEVVVGLADVSYPDLAGSAVRSNPVSATVRLEPVPSSIEAVVRLRPSQRRTDATLLTSAGAPVRALARVDAIRGQVAGRTDTGSRRTIEVAVDALPQTIDLTAEAQATGATHVTARSSAPISSVRADVTDVTTLADPDTYRLVHVEARGVPDALALRLAPAQISYQASAVMPSLTASVDDVRDGNPDRGAFARATGVPSEMLITTEALTATGRSVSYEANGRMDRLEVGLFDRASGLTGEIAANSLPRSVKAMFDRGLASIETGSAIGELSGKLSTRSTPVSVQPGSFLSITQTAAGGIGAAFRIVGLSGARVTAAADRIEAVLDAAAQDVSVTYAGPQARGSVLISRLPSHVAVTITPDRADYSASAPVDRVAAHAELAGSVIDAEIRALPERVSIGWITGAETTIDMSSSAPTGRVAARLRRGALDVEAALEAVGPALVVRVKPGASGSVRFSGQRPTRSASVRLTQPGTQLAFDLQDIPADVAAAWQSGNAPELHYVASGRLGTISAGARFGSQAFEAVVESLPRVFDVVVSESDLSFVARSAPGAPAASDEVGKILLRATNDGSFADRAPAEDHAVLIRRPDAMRAELVYSGLRSLTVRTVDDSLRADLRSSAARLFTAVLDTPGSSASATIDKVPSQVAVDVSSGLTVYTASGPVSRVTAALASSTGARAGVDVFDVPSSIRLEQVGGRAAWTSSAAVSRVVATATRPSGGRTWEVLVDLTGVPVAWTMDTASAKPGFNAGQDRIGSVFAAVTNHGSVTTFAGNHASVVVADDDVDASFRMTGISRIELEDTDLRLRAAMTMNTPTFFLNADLRRSNARAVGRLTMAPMPASIELTQAGGAMTFEASSNFDLNLDSVLGDRRSFANVPSPRQDVHGLSVRDGSCGPACAPCPASGACAPAVKAHAFLQGFPTRLSADAARGTVSLTGFRPPTGAGLTLDADIRAIAPRMTLTATQSGIPAPTDMTLGPFTTANEGSTRTMTAAYLASGPLGPLVVDVQDGTNVGQLTVSNIPSRMNVSVSLGPETKRVSTSMSQGIATVQARMRLASSPGWQATLGLGDVPSHVQLTFGTLVSRVLVRVDEPCTGPLCLPFELRTIKKPGLSYEASDLPPCFGGGCPVRRSVNTLDVAASVDAALVGGSASGRISLDIRNLGGSTTFALDGSAIDIRSNFTESLDISGWAQTTIRQRVGEDCLPGCGAEVRMRYEGRFKLDPIIIEDFSMKITNFRDLRLTGGFTSSLTGDYETFSMGWKRLTGRFDLSLDTRYELEMFGADWSTRGPNKSVGNLAVAGVRFHSAKNVNLSFFSVPPFVPCLGRFGIPNGKLADFHFFLRPRPDDVRIDAVSVSKASEQGGAWLITAEPLISSAGGTPFSTIPKDVISVLASLTSPLGGGFVDSHCHALV